MSDRAQKKTDGERFAEPMLFEVAWETCQQVGGIYTVLRSKTPFAVRNWGDRYCLIGPYMPETTPAEFEECPPDGPFAAIVRRLHEQGIEVHHGRWLITGRPRCLLIDPRTLLYRLNEIAYRLWDHHHIATVAADELLKLVQAFGYGVEQIFRTLVDLMAPGVTAIAHFHEWMAATCIPELRRDNLPLAIVFTTHATLLGRYLAMHDPWFYDHVPFVDWMSNARRFNIETQVSLERAAAHGAHVFTTVSDITACECEHLLGRAPDILLPNGLNIERFVALHEFQNLHRQYKEAINQFVIAHFFPSYSFDLDRTIYCFISGRYEYRNKGFDMTIEAMARLNWRMKQAHINRTVVFFIVTKRPIRSLNTEALHRRAMMGEMRDNCEAIKLQLGDRLFTSTAMGQTPRYDDLVDDYWKLRLRRMIHAWHSNKLPTIVTHDLEDEGHDEILNQLRSTHLFNAADDPVKVVYHPEFVSANDPLFALDYDQFVRGCHIGIFPSAYEPWGYAPLECTALGLPSVTSDLSGFGTYLLRNMPDHEQNGLYVIRRRYTAYDAAVNQLSDRLFDFLSMGRRDRIALRNRAESCAEHFDWGSLGRHYTAAHQLALKRVKELP